MKCVQVKLSRDYDERLSALSEAQGRPRSWYIWRGLTRHVLPAYEHRDGGGAPQSASSRGRKCIFSLDDDAALRLEAFCAESGRTKQWAVRTALEEYVFPTYEAGS